MWKPKRKRLTRSESLLLLGFHSYKKYLASDLWIEIRQRALERDGGKCCKCGGKATQVHHKHYALVLLSGKDISGLVCCCGDCHHFAEFHPNGNKAKTSVANKKLDGTYDPSAKHRSQPWIGRYYAARQSAKRKS